MPASTETAVRRRPKNRKNQIVEAARELIGELGYRNVSMAQIAERVGITAGALYRHFSNKAVLLEAVIAQSFDELLSPTADPDTTLDEVLTRACEQAVARRDVGGLWWRESRHLGPDAFARLRRRLQENNRDYQALIRAERPGLSRAGAEKLALGVQSILASPSFHATKLPDTQFTALLLAASRAVSVAELSSRRPPTPRRRRRLQPVSKRELLLTHAVTLFEQNGFEATSLNDIGAAAGVTGPNLYGYFASKADIRDTAITRGISALWLLLHGVLRDSDEPAEALRALVRGYAQLALDQTILASELLTEQRNIDDVARARQREYVAEWVALLRLARPDLDETSARVLVHTALSVIHNMAPIGRDRNDPAFVDDLAAIATAVLFAPQNRGTFGLTH